MGPRTTIHSTGHPQAAGSSPKRDGWGELTGSSGANFFVVRKVRRLYSTPETQRTKECPLPTPQIIRIMAWYSHLNEGPSAVWPRVLCLDSGGPYALSSLYVLDAVMREIATENGTERYDTPSQFFDLIAGSGTGGLFALMLGRLGMVYAVYLCIC